MVLKKLLPLILIISWSRNVLSKPEYEVIHSGKNFMTGDILYESPRLDPVPINKQPRYSKEKDVEDLKDHIGYLHGNSKSKNGQAQNLITVKDPEKHVELTPASQFGNVYYSTNPNTISKNGYNFRVFFPDVNLREQTDDDRTEYRLIINQNDLNRYVNGFRIFL